MTLFRNLQTVTLMNTYMNFFSNPNYKEFILHGNTQKITKPVELRAGKLTMILENRSLRYISCGSTELVRMIYSAVRDREWITLDPAISNEFIETFSDSFIIKYKALYKSGESSLIADIAIQGKSDSSIEFSFEAEALTDFEKNRAGICVLHPLKGVAGKICEITHTNDEKESSEFPLYIAPFQPFTDIKSMKFSIEGFECTLSFTGEVFETEDQRNWTDASFKTYCTPLRLPYPVTLAKGETISQKVELRLTGNPVALRKSRKHDTVSLVRRRKINIPLTGISRSTRPGPLSDSEMRIISKLRFDHYRIDLHLFDSSWKDDADTAVAEARKMNFRIEFALFFDDQASREAITFIEWLKTKDISPAVILILHKSESTTPDCVADSVAMRFKNAFPDVKIATGTNANFAQLNRFRPASKLSDLICYSIHPQEHASDLKTLAENNTSQKDTVINAKSFSSGKGVWVSPVNIQRRFNANTEYYEKPYTGQGIPPQVDPRLMSLFGASWTIGSLKYLIESEPAGVTYFETAGERGIFQGDMPSRWPLFFQSEKGMIFPVYFVFLFLLKHKSCKAIQTISSAPFKTECLAFTDGKRTDLMIANYTSDSLKIKIDDISGVFIIRQLNEFTYRDAAFDPDWLEKEETEITENKSNLNLSPFSVTFLEEIS